MNDFSVLKKLAEAANQKSDGAPWAYEPHGDTGDLGVGVLEDDQGNCVTGRQVSGEMLVLESVAPEVSCEAYAAFIAAANPAAVLALIAENDRLKHEIRLLTEHNEFLASSGSRLEPELRVVKDALGLDFTASVIGEVVPLIEALRKSDERYQWLRSRIPGSAYRIAGVIYSEGGLGVDAGIDAAMSKEGK